MERDLLYDCIGKNRILKCASLKNIDRYLTEQSVFVRSFCPADIIYSKDSSKKCVGIIISGKAMCEPYGAKDNTLLRIMSENDTFGIANLYCDTEPFPSIITAKTAVTALFIDGDAFCSLIENDVSALKAYLAFLSSKVVYLNKKISTLTAGNTERKLAAYISKNASDDMRLTCTSMSSLAEMLGVGRASLYRALDELTYQGIISRQGKTITIHDKNALLGYKKS
jgi:CRP-like cAMP-binding protein